MLRQLLLGAALALVLSGCGTQPAPIPPTLSAAPSPSPSVKPDGTCNCTPKALRIPAIKVDTKVIGQVGLQKSGAMEVPPLSQPKEIAWYKYSPVPGDLGPSVVISHRNGDGQQGGFAALDKVQVGDLIDVDRSDGLTARFKVIATRLIPKSQMDGAQARQVVYGNTVDPELRLITCSGDLNRAIHSYEDNRVVSASLSDLFKTLGN